MLSATSLLIDLVGGPGGAALAQSIILVTTPGALMPFSVYSDNLD